MDAEVTEKTGGVAPLGRLLREWRIARRLSQLDLALDANISTRHLSCVETGKSQASRELIVRLADTLDVPLRERNAMLVAAGYAPKYPESALETPALAQVRRAIDAILTQQEPYPAFLLNRRWDVLDQNAAATRVNRFVLGGRDSRHDNMLRQFFDPDDLRGTVANWEEIAGSLIHHLHSAVAAAPGDETTRTLLAEVLAYPGVPSRWRRRDIEAGATPLMTTVMQRGGDALHFFSTITTFGTPHDVTLEELHIECSFPADDETAAACRAMFSA